MTANQPRLRVWKDATASAWNPWLYACERCTMRDGRGPTYAGMAATLKEAVRAAVASHGADGWQHKRFNR